MKNSEKTMDKIVALCKGRGFVYSGSEIYGGLANTWNSKTTSKLPGARSLYRKALTTLASTLQS